MISKNTKSRIARYSKQKDGLTQKLNKLGKLPPKGTSSLALLAAINVTPVEVFGQTNCNGTNAAMNIISTIPNYYGYAGPAIDLDMDGIADVDFLLNGASSLWLIRPHNAMGTICLGLLNNPNPPCNTSICFTDNYGIDDRDVFSTVALSGGGWGFIEVRNLSIVAFGQGFTSSSDISYTDCAQTCADNTPQLPVELISFEAKVSDENIALNWRTASEENNAGFEIERSTDGKTFQNITFIEGKGTTSVIQSYNYDDKDLRKGQVYYYRLKQIDFDGKFEYSNIVQAQIGENSLRVTFSPNPSKGNTALNLFTMSQGQVTINIYNANGQVFLNTSYKAQKGENNISLNLTELPKGLYFAKVEINGALKYDKLIID